MGVLAFLTFFLETTSFLQNGFTQLLPMFVPGDIKPHAKTTAAKLFYFKKCLPGPVFVYVGNGDIPAVCSIFTCQCSTKSAACAGKKSGHPSLLAKRDVGVFAFW